MIDKRCDWEQCQTIITIRKSSMTTSDYCHKHNYVFAAFRDAQERFCKKNQIKWPISNKDYEKYKTEFAELRTTTEKNYNYIRRLFIHDLPG